MTRSFRGLMLTLGIVGSLSLAVAGPAAAQTDVSVDIAGIGENVLAADPDLLLEGLEEPMRDRDLPDGFSDAEFVPAEDVTADLGLLANDHLDGTLGSAAYVLVGDPDLLGGETVAVSIQYIAYDADDLGSDPVADFVEGAEGGLVDVPEGAEASVDTIDLEGEDAALITFSQSDANNNAVAQYIAIPAGNVFVFTTVTVTGEEEVDADSVLEATAALTLSAIEHLGEVASDS